MYEELLKKFIEQAKKVPEIIAVYYAGSTAKGTMDKYSDLDIDIVLEDKNFTKIYKKLLSLAKIFGNIKFYHFYNGELAAFVRKDYLKVEIDPIKKSSLKPNLFLKTIKIIFDREGTLTKIYKKSLKLKKPRIEIKHEEIITFLLALRDGQIYTARHCARGLKFSAKSELDNLGGHLFWFLAEIKGMKDYELLRTAEKNLSKEEKIFLNAARCKSLNKKEIQRTAKANWKFMKYLEKQYEKITKRKLNLKCNDEEILKIINKTYREAK